MLRRAPTSISLSIRDVEEHFKHIKQEKAKICENSSPVCRQHSSSSSSTGLIELRPERHYYYEHSKISPLQDHGLQNISSASFFSISFGSVQIGRAPEDAKRPSTVSPDQLPTVLEDDGANAKVHVESTDRDGFIPVTSPSSSESVEEPPKLPAVWYSERASIRVSNELDHGKLEEETNEDVNSYFGTSAASPNSLSAPQDISTLRSINFRDAHKLHAQVSFPRSPLAVSHEVDLPQRLPTSSLSHRIALHGTPNILLSRPARRSMPYGSRMISHTFEDLERADAAYVEVQSSDNESIRSRPLREEWRSMQEELEERSTQSIFVDNSVPSSPPNVAVDIAPTSRRSSQTEQISGGKRVFYSSSPHHSLPPPFSAVRRIISSTAALPSQSRSLSASPPQSSIRGLQASPAAVPSSGANKEYLTQEPGNALRSLATLPLRLLELYRSRSPLPSRNESGDQESRSPMPGRGSEGRTRAVSRSVSARPPIHVYDDRLPASSQPQTPEHLPESRHQSRFHPSYTVPSSAQIERPQLRQFTNDRRRGTRSNSPPGLMTPGFRGLYGGQENTEEDIIFDRAAQRLFASPLIRGRRHSIYSTPERERSFAAAERRDD